MSSSPFGFSRPKRQWNIVSDAKDPLSLSSITRRLSAPIVTARFAFPSTIQIGTIGLSLPRVSRRFAPPPSRGDHQDADKPQLSSASHERDRGSSPAGHSRDPKRGSATRVEGIPLSGVLRRARSNSPGALKQPPNRRGTGDRGVSARTIAADAG
jgi:hypothetical protein